MLTIIARRILLRVTHKVISLQGDVENSSSTLIRVSLLVIYLGG